MLFRSQIAALNPRFWDKSQVTEDVLAEEKKIALALMDTDPKMANKPAQVKEKIVMGKMNKFYEENCLMQMEFVRGDIFQGSVEKYIADAAKKLGGSIKFVDAVRFQTGEGIEGRGLCSRGCSSDEHGQEVDRKSTRLNSSHKTESRMPSSA